MSSDHRLAVRVPFRSREPVAPRHSVEFYSDDHYLLENLSCAIGSALIAGDSAIVIATAEHREALAQLFATRGLNLRGAIREGRYVSLEASEVLASLMIDGSPDPEKFFNIVGAVVAAAESAAQGAQRRVVAFGEMVALLFAKSQLEAALALEELWHRLAETHNFFLHCAYPISAFSNPHDADSLARICAAHQHVTPAESYTHLTTDKDRAAAITILQQKANALEIEMKEREKAQRTLEKREAELRDFVENAIIPIHWVTGDGTILWANKAELNLLGYSPEEYFGHSIAEFYVDREQINQILDHLTHNEELHGYNARLRRKDGSIRHVQIHSNVLFENGNFVHTRCFTVDVTQAFENQRRIAEQHKALQESEQRFRVITDASPVLVWMAGTDKLCFYFNKGWLEFVGRTLEQEAGNGWAENVHPDDFDRCLQIYTTCFDARQSFEMEYRLRHHSGQYRWILDCGVPRYATDGTFQGYVGGCLDIHDRKEAGEVRHRLAAIVESSNDAIVSKDLNGIVTSWNQRAEKMFGFTAEEIVGKPVTMIIPPELHQDEDMILGKIRSGQRIDHFETVRLTKSGDRIDVSLSISPVRDEHGKIIGAAKIARDITENKKLEHTLRMTEKIVAAGRLAATVAHEINNPLETVTNFVYLAKTSPEVPPNIWRYLDQADQELARVAHIARQTLGFYRDSSRPSCIDLSRVVDDILTIYQRKLENKNISLYRRINSGVQIFAVEGEVKQVLSNLIANAIDASDSGTRISVCARPVTGPKGQTCVRLLVADQGEGIRPEHKRNLFAPFFTTKKDVGTGLGLWITKDLVEKGGGSIHIRSRVGERSGTVVAITLPSQNPLSSEKVA